MKVIANNGFTGKALICFLFEMITGTLNVNLNPLFGVPESYWSLTGPFIFNFATILSFDFLVGAYFLPL